MANISLLSQLVAGVQRQVDLSANTLEVQAIQINGTLLSSSTSGSAGSKLVGDDNSYSHFTPTAATVKGALAGIDSALASGGASPGGSNGNVQYNHSSAFGGDSQFTTDGSGNVNLQSLVIYPYGNNFLRIWDQGPNANMQIEGANNGGGIFPFTMKIGGTAVITWPYVSGGTVLGGLQFGQAYGGAIHRETSSTTITIGDGIAGLIVDYGSVQATGTITMTAHPFDGQEVFIAAGSNGITSLTLSPNSGQSIVAPISTLTAGTSARYAYVAASTTWYAIDYVPSSSVDINASYTYTATGTGIAGSNTAVSITSTYVTYTKLWDTNNAFSTSTGAYTVPVSGKYRVTAVLEYTANSTGARFCAITQAGSVSRFAVLDYDPIPSSGAPAQPGGTATFNCSAGDTLTLTGQQSSGTTLTVAPDGADYNYIEFERIGS